MTYDPRNLVIDLLGRNAALTDSMAETNRARELQQAASRRASRSKNDVYRLKKEVEELEKKLEAAEVLLGEKEKILLEWMHSQEAFQSLARLYGKELNLSDEKRAENFKNVVLRLAEEKVKFCQTNLFRKAKSGEL